MSSSWEIINVGSLEMPAYVSAPSGSGTLPAIIVIHHVVTNDGGPDEFTCEFADRLAGEGFFAISPDLFHRSTPEMVATTGKGRAQLVTDSEAIDDIAATVDYLLQQPSVNRDRLGITGFCVAGGIVWLAAATNPHFKAAVPHYGSGILTPRGTSEESAFQLSNGINCPMLFHFGELDQNPSQEDKGKLDAELTRLRKTYEFYTYPDVGHGFMDYTTPQRYQKEAADTAWQRTLEFFDTHLKAPPSGSARSS